MVQNPYDRLSVLFAGNESLITELYNLIFNHYFFSLWFYYAKHSESSYGKTLPHARRNLIMITSD